MNDLTIFAAAKALAGGALLTTAYAIWSAERTPVADASHGLPEALIVAGALIMLVSLLSTRDPRILAAAMLVGTGLVIEAVLIIPPAHVGLPGAIMLGLGGLVGLLGAAFTDH